jgi:homoserine trans-succinylase
MVDAPLFVAEACRFYGWTFDEAWNMPASRFFAMRRAMHRVQAQEGLEKIDVAAVAIADSKYHKHLCDRYVQRLEYVDEVASKAEPIFDTDEQMQAKADVAMRNIALMRRLQFGR